MPALWIEAQAYITARITGKYQSLRMGSQPPADTGGYRPLGAGKRSATTGKRPATAGKRSATTGKRPATSYPRRAQLYGKGRTMSIRDIAKRAGVSASTVSRVLNNPGYRCASPELRDTIWRIAREMNYLPNEAARSLKMGAASREESSAPRRVDVIVTRASQRQPDPFFGELLRIIETETHSQRCLISQLWYLSSLNIRKGQRAGVTERELAAVLGTGVSRGDGLIVIGKCSEAVLQRLVSAYSANVVSVGRNSCGYLCDEVLCDGEKIARIAVGHLIDLGHTSIGYAGDCHNESRYRGYQRTLLEHGLDVSVGSVVECEHTEEAGYQAMERLMQADEAPTAIYCATDAIAIGMLRCLNDHRSRYYSPSIVASDDIEAAQYANPALTTVALPKREMGRFALQLLIDRLSGGHSANVRMELPGKLVVRASCSSPEDAHGFNYVI